MTTLYRTPNITVDEFEFHMAVILRKGRARRHTRWRLLSERPQAWCLIAAFKGHPPKPALLAKKFAPFKRHISQAEESPVVARDLARRRAERFSERASA